MPRVTANDPEHSSRRWKALTSQSDTDLRVMLSRGLGHVLHSWLCSQHEPAPADQRGFQTLRQLQQSHPHPLQQLYCFSSQPSSRTPQAPCTGQAEHPPLCSRSNPAPAWAILYLGIIPLEMGHGTLQSTQGCQQDQLCLQHKRVLAGSSLWRF